MRNTKWEIKSEIVVFVDHSHVFDRLIEFLTEKNIVDLVRSKSPFDFSDICCCYLTAIKIMNNCSDNDFSRNKDCN